MAVNVMEKLDALLLHLGEADKKWYVDVTEACHMQIARCIHADVASACNHVAFAQVARSIVTGRSLKDFDSTDVQCYSTASAETLLQCDMAFALAVAHGSNLKKLGFGDVLLHDEGGAVDGNMDMSACGCLGAVARLVALSVQARTATAMHAGAAFDLGSEGRQAITFAVNAVVKFAGAVERSSAAVLVYTAGAKENAEEYRTAVLQSLRKATEATTHRLEEKWSTYENPATAAFVERSHEDQTEEDRKDILKITQSKENKRAFKDWSAVKLVDQSLQVWCEKLDLKSEIPSLKATWESIAPLKSIVASNICIHAMIGELPAGKTRSSFMEGVAKKELSALQSSLPTALSEGWRQRFALV